jgi:uncharacterized membrane protein (UPF0127 family)
LALTPPATAQRVDAAGATWCRAVPVERTFCRALVIAVPAGTLRVAVADTDARRERGLMGVGAVPHGEGMLFVFPDADDAERDFWMKDTITPLDMIFIRVDGTISTIAANVPATKPATSDAAVARRAGVGRYVLELGAGGAHRAGLRTGDRLVLPALAAS